MRGLLLTSKVSCGYVEVIYVDPRTFDIMKYFFHGNFSQHLVPIFRPKTCRDSLSSESLDPASDEWLLKSQTSVVIIVTTFKDIFWQWNSLNRTINVTKMANSECVARIYLINKQIIITK